MPRSKPKVEVIAYRATNKVDGASYIGITSRGLAARERQHRRTADRGQGYYLHNAIRKHGHDNIVFEQIADFDGDIELAKLYEIEAIAKYKPAYNLTLGGDGKAGPLSPGALAKFRIKRAGIPSYRKGVPLSEEHKRRISESNKGQVPWSKGKPLSAERREKLRQANLGNKHMLGTRRSEICQDRIDLVSLRKTFPYLNDLRAPKKDKPPKVPRQRLYQPMSEEQRQKRQDRMLGRKIPSTPAREAALAISIVKAQTANKKPVRCLNDNQEFPSAADAAAYYGVKAQLLRQCIRRGQTMRNGLKFVEVAKSP